MTTNRPIWEEGEKDEYAPLAGPARADVCVIGLGGSGLACIEELLAAGHEVIGIDQGEIGGGAAGRNGGLLLAGAMDFYHDLVQEVGQARGRQFYLDTLKEIDRFETETPDLVRRTGSLRIAASVQEEEDCQEQYKIMQEDGLPVEWYDGVQGKGLLFRQDAVFQPLARVRRKAKRMVGLGARLFEQSTALGLEEGVVRLEKGYVECDQIVVAVDGGIEQLVPELQGRVRTARLQMLSTRPVEQQVARPVYFRYGHDYWQQMPDGRVALGGGRDKGGEGEWCQTPGSSSEVQGYLKQLLSQQLGMSEEKIERQWGACVGYTKSGLPVIEEVSTGLWACGGYSGTGNLIGAMAGRAVARAIGGDGQMIEAMLREGAGRP